MSANLSQSQWLETYKSLIALSSEGFKFSALANGGAAVALLAYLGNVTGKEASVPDLRCAMFLFLSGLTACGFSMLFAYLTQLKLLNELGQSKGPVVAHSWLLWIAIVLFLLSIVGFGAGSWEAVTSFR